MGEKQHHVRRCVAGVQPEPPSERLASGKKLDDLLPKSSFNYYFRLSETEDIMVTFPLFIFHFLCGWFQGYRQKNCLIEIPG